MDIQAITNVVLEQATIWAPALTAVIGTIVAFVGGSNKVKNELSALHTATEDLQEQKAIKELTGELRAVKNEIKDLRRQKQKVLDKVSHIKNYRIDEDLRNEQKE